MKLYPTQTWGALTVESVETKRHTRQDAPGITDTLTCPVATLSCNCGGEIEIRVRDFPGQSEMKDCGCGSAAEFVIPRRGRPKSEPKVITSVYMDLVTRGEIQQYAHSNNLSFGASVIELARLGLASL